MGHLTKRVLLYILRLLLLKRITLGVLFPLPIGRSFRTYIAGRSFRTYGIRRKDRLPIASFLCARSLASDVRGRCPFKLAIRFVTRSRAIFHSGSCSSSSSPFRSYQHAFSSEICF